MADILKKRVFPAVLASVLLFALAACGNAEDADTSDVSETSDTPAVTTSAVSETTSADPSRFVVGAKTDGEIGEQSESDVPDYADPLAYNFLTGEAFPEKAESARRPTAVSVNNLSTAAKYQCGLSKADIVFEVEVEGGITRLLALFADPSEVGKLGSIRSARPVMVGIALGFDAYFVHSGGSKQAYSELAQYGVPDIDGMKAYAGYFYYDDAIVKATSLEHGYFTSGNNVASAIEKYDSGASRTEIKHGYNDFLNFYVSPTDIGGEPAARVTTKYGSYCPYFVYSEADGLYYRWQYGRAHTDYSTGEQLSFCNVIVLSVDSWVISNDSAGRRQFDDVGSGNGILASKGTYINIKWEKPSYDAPLTLTAEDGSPLYVNIGSSFISYVDGESNILVSAE
ncbi:MAG: DUF3048 domain-containing protein [Clostridiales bacterium]|nr:DUF3048 domain-containing protein [Clostridiales bacterium]